MLKLCGIIMKPYMAKGPCDDIGGTTKRLADEAVRQEKVSIQDASGFMTWAENNQQASAIEFLFVDKKETEASRAFLSAHVSS